MAAELIPAKWRAAVCAILRAQDESRIEVTTRAKLDWAATFPDADWAYVMYDEFRKFLERDDAFGRAVPTMRESGDVYEFIFPCMGRPMYGKINLKPNGDLLIIYSAHPPLKGETL